MTLQVRQIMLKRVPASSTGAAYITSEGAWHDVPSPGWLIGFTLPHPGFAYEFRNAEEQTDGR